MACPIPIRLFNPRYKKDSKLTGKPITYYEQFDDCYLDVPCGKCYHCLKRYKSSWNFRLQEHYRYLSQADKRQCYFITLTFDDNHLPPNNRKSIGRLIRLFLERVRKRYKKSVTHWLCTELGDTTKRLHLHGILFVPPFPIHKLDSLWQYGYVSYATLTERRITYVTSYINKQLTTLLQDVEDKQYVFCSPGIGKAFATDQKNINISHYHDTQINPFTYFGNRPFPLPRYLRQKLFTPEELESAKLAYFANLSEDVIPPGPFVIGHKVYDDYTIFLRDALLLREQYKSKYLKIHDKLWQTKATTLLNP